MKSRIKKEIITLVNKYKEDDTAKSGYDINNGLCEEFANEIVKSIGSDRICVVELYNFMIGEDGDIYGNDIFDVDMMEKYWADTVPTKDLTWEEISKIPFGYHVWISYDGRHYDAECPEGVDNFFELPLFKKYIDKS